MGAAAPETMTALRVHSPGAMPRAERVPMPSPGPGEALVRMTASAVGHHDLGVVAGTFPHPAPPFVPGLEGSGIVAALDEEAAAPALAIGTPVRVVARGQAGGTWAEYAVAPARALVPVPDGLDPAVAAACGSVSAAAWAALELAQPGEAESVGVTGASGAVGSLVGQLAAQRGVARVVGWTRTPAALPAGVEHAGEDGPVGPNGAVEPVDVLIDTAGGELLPRRLRSVRPGGRAVLVGYAAGERVCFELPELMVLDVALLPLNMMRRRVPREIALELLGDFAAGRLALRTDVTGLDGLADAIERLREGRASGRVVLRW